MVYRSIKEQPLFTDRFQFGAIYMFYNFKLQRPYFGVHQHKCLCHTVGYYVPENLCIYIQYGGIILAKTHERIIINVRVLYI